MVASISCPGCGHQLAIADEEVRRSLQCPACGLFWDVPPLARTNEDDGKPYRLAGGEEHRCPKCRAALATDTLVCVQCGRNQQTGKKAVRNYGPLEKRWDAGLSMPRRLILFILAECAALVLALVGALLAGQPGDSVTSLLTFTVLMAFLLGTFDRLTLTRNARGRVVLTQTWRVLFMARSPTPIALREYEGITVQVAYAVGPLDWIILGITLLVGILPGLIWWFWAMRRDTYTVALTKNHGFPERILYRGWSESRAQEIAHTVQAVTGLSRAE